MADLSNGLCYIVLPNMDYQYSGVDTCYDSYDADLLVFDMNSDVEGFLTLLKSGEIDFRVGNSGIFTK